MVNRPATLSLVPRSGSDPESDELRLDAVFQALSDPTRREILRCLDGAALLVSELAAKFEISLQGVSRHIQVLVRAGLISQERTGRISRCSLSAGPLYDAAVWLNQYTRYWQQQFDVLASTLAEIDARRDAGAPRPAKRKAGAHAPRKGARRPSPRTPR
jgi:DNA-binding transcriptional ArsR family regulator